MIFLEKQQNNSIKFKLKQKNKFAVMKNFVGKFTFKYFFRKKETRALIEFSLDDDSQINRVY